MSEFWEKENLVVRGWWVKDLITHYEAKRSQELNLTMEIKGFDITTHLSHRPQEARKWTYYTVCRCRCKGLFHRLRSWYRRKEMRVQHRIGVILVPRLQEIIRTFEETVITPFENGRWYVCSSSKMISVQININRTNFCMAASFSELRNRHSACTLLYC